MFGLIFKFSIAFTHRAPPNRKCVEAPGQLLHVSECVDSDGVVGREDRAAFRGGDRQGLHTQRLQGGVKIKRSQEGRQDYLPLVTSISCGTVGPHARPCILLGIETFCALSSAAIIISMS